jgi:hypothetical protein
MNNFKIDKKCSQAYQDQFVAELIGPNGTYIEIGAHLPKKRSNTYNLEVYGKYKGFSIEFDSSYKEFWEICNERSNPVFWEDALTFNYKETVDKLGLGTHINYLSVDIEPPCNTFSALQKVINDGITFDVITFEHDQYQSKDNYHQIACDFLIALGYKVAVTNVYHKNPSRIFETWFVSNRIDFKEIDFKDWLNRS